MLSTVLIGSCVRLPNHQEVKVAPFNCLLLTSITITQKVPSRREESGKKRPNLPAATAGWRKHTEELTLYTAHADRDTFFGSLTCSFYYSFKYHHNFKLLSLHGPQGEVVEGAFGVNHMTDGEGGDEEELVCTGAETDVQLQLIQRKKLPLRCLAGLRECRERDRNVWLLWKEDTIVLYTRRTFRRGTDRWGGHRPSPLFYAGNMFNILKVKCIIKCSEK